jgi:hypothetical protein
VQLCTVLGINFDENLETSAFACHFGHQLPVSDSHFLSTNYETSSSSSSMARNWQHPQMNMSAYILHLISHLIETKILQIEDMTNFQNLQIWIA